MPENKTVHLHLDRVEEQIAIFSDDDGKLFTLPASALSFPPRDGMAVDGTLENGALINVTPCSEEDGREERICALQKKLFHSETK